MTADIEDVYWLKDKEWYKIVDGRIVATDKAPERARKSLELYYEKNWAKLNPGREKTNINRII